MSSTRYTTFVVVLSLVLCQWASICYGQLGVSFDVKKPKEFDNRVLRSEKSDKKKFTAPRRFMQNTFTHYNYFFNANNKLNEVLDKAKASFKDDYSLLLPFYNYSLDVTAADSTQLDSIAYKAQTGIILHDLRSDWADNMYLLWGASYYLQKQYDSAYLMFQFINWAFAEKEKDGYYRTIGSARDGNRASSITTKEKTSLTNRLFKEPPSRNDAFIWQIRNHLAQDKFTEAASIITALKNDSLFPKRLQNDLEEVQAWSYYKQQQWDSSAAHLELALSNATNKQELARWEYLLGQLYEKTGAFIQSETYYAKTISHTTDPIMDIYARLGSIRVNKDGGEDYINKNIATLVKMAKRDKYDDYRDIIYYMAAQMELEQNNIDAALALLQKSVQYTTNNPTQRNKAFLQLAELSFNKELYRQSYNFYDSLRMDDPAITDPDAINVRKNILARLATNSEVLVRQDSLQKLAAMQEDDRKELVKKMVRLLRKQQGLKEEGTSTGSLPAQQQVPVSLFADNSKKGEWYFYNTTSRQKGAADFKSRWGTRKNTDNWRRSSAQTGALNASANTNTGKDLTGRDGTTTAIDEPVEITYETLYDKIPVTAEKMQKSKDSVSNALFNLGMIYIQELENCSAGTKSLEELRINFPLFVKMDEALFNLYYCYSKNGDANKAAAIKKVMEQQYPGSNFTTIATTGKNPKSHGQKSEATKTYEKIYDLFIEGNFTDAIARKKSADSEYGANHWTPQLLYIEAVYYIKQRQDSTAKVVLNNILNQFAGSPLAEKATTMIDVLNRRQQIEEELRNLVIVMPAEDTANPQPVIATIPKPLPTAPVVLKDTAANKPLVTIPSVNVKDTAVAKPVITAPIAITKPAKDTVITKPTPPPALSYQYVPDEPHYVVVILNKVDPIFVTEARNAFARHNRDTYYNKQMQAELVEIDTDNRLLLLSPFKNAAEAITYVDQTKPRTASEIVPWLKGGKYSFTIITTKNLELLKTTKSIDKYQQFLQQQVPGKF
jgi:outer membrane protein assembly factor BamD (BamD/ComL family)